MPKVSVIIPFYNNRKWLEESLESVYNQTFNDYEVILINDGSEDDITDILTKYEGRIKYLFQENAGPGAARNNGIRHAEGEYIAFQDSDDIWLPTKLEKQVSFMKQTGAKWSHVGFYDWWPNTGKLQYVDSSRDYDDISIQCYISTKIATPAVMIHKSVYDSNEYYFPENIRNGEDGAIYSKLAQKYKLALIQEPLVKVRMRGSNSYSHAIERFEINANSYLKMLENKHLYKKGIIFIKGIYYVYHKIMGKKFSPVREFIAKCLWVFPYSLERIYLWYIVLRANKDEKYIKRW